MGFWEDLKEEAGKWTEPTDVEKWLGGAAEDIGGWFYDPSRWQGKPEEERRREEEGIYGGETQANLAKLLWPAAWENFQAATLSGDPAAQGQATQELLSVYAAITEGTANKDVELFAQLALAAGETDDPMAAFEQVGPLLGELYPLMPTGEEEEGVGFDSEAASQLYLDQQQQTIEMERMQFQRYGIMDIVGSFPQAMRGQVMMSFLEQPELRSLFLPTAEEMGMNAPGAGLGGLGGDGSATTGELPIEQQFLEAYRGGR